MYKNTKHDSQGFTLIELLLYVVLATILLTSLMSFIGLIGASQVKNKTISEVTQQGVFLMDSITRTIRSADTVTQPAAGVSAATLTVTVPTAANSPTVFSLSSGVVRMTEGAGSPIALTSPQVQVTNLTFTNLTRLGSRPIIRVSATVNRSASAGLQEYSFQRTFVSSAEMGW
jgi:Tfp pilus assembly protein PilW